MGIPASAASWLSACSDAHESVRHCLRRDDGKGGEREIFDAVKGFVPFTLLGLKEGICGKQEFGDVECGNGGGRSGRGREQLGRRPEAPACRFRTGQLAGFQKGGWRM